MTERCCGSSCDVQLMQSQLKAKGASEFVAYLEENITEDVSAAAIEQLLVNFRIIVLGLRHYGTR